MEFLFIIVVMIIGLVFVLGRFALSVADRRDIARKLKASDWETRLKAVNAIAADLLEKPNSLQAKQVLGILEHDNDWHIRSEAVKIIDDYLQSKGLLSRSLLGYSSFDHQLVEAVIHALEDEHPDVREAVAITLGNTPTISAVKPLIRALSDPNENVRKSVAVVLEDVCPTVETLVFGDNEKITSKNQKRTAYNLDVSLLDVPFSNLEEIMIETETSNDAQIDAFVKYLQTAFDRQYLKKSVIVRIYGDPTGIGEHICHVWNTCKAIDISIKTIAFGMKRQRFHRPHSILHNPDVSRLSLPLSRLEQVVIHTPTYNFRQVECFLTYAVNVLGQAFLKKHVEVHIYEDSEQLHPNLLNNFTNLCKNVYSHAEDDMLVSMRIYKQKAT